MIKSSRSRAKNPEQEKLREEKSDWNQDASETIGDLIALKKSINGRGDIKRNLPPSRIHQPFPPEISSFLQETSSEAQEVLQDAKQIIERQNRQAKKDASDVGFFSTKTASTSMSRFWAKIKLYFTLDKMVYNFRMRMLKEGANITETISKIQSELLEQDPESLALALSSASLLRSQFMGPFTQNYDRLFENILQMKKLESEVGKPNLSEGNSDVKAKNNLETNPEIKEEKISKPSEEKNKPDQEEKKPEQPIDGSTNQIQKEPEKELEEEAKTVKRVDSRALRLLKDQRDKIILEAKEYLPVITALEYNLYHQMDQVSNKDKIAARHAMQGLRRTIVALEVMRENVLHGNAPYNTDSILNEERLIDAAITNYFTLLKIMQAHVAPGNSFPEIFSVFKSQNKKALLEFALIKTAEYRKEAKEGIWDWIRRKFKSVTSDSVQLLAMDSVRVASKSERALNDLLDDLEDEKITIQVLDGKMAIFAQLLQSLVEKLITLGNMQSSNVRRIDRTKNWNQINIRPSDLQDLQKFYHELESYAKPFDFSKHGLSSN